MFPSGSTAKRLAVIGVVALVVGGVAVFGPPIDANDAGDGRDRRSTDAPSSPSITGVDSRVADVTQRETTVESAVHIRAPSAKRENVALDYAVTANDVQLVSTERRVAVDRDTATVPLTTRFSNDRIVQWWVSHIRNDQRTDRTVTVALRASGDTLDRIEKRRTVETAMLSGFNSTATRPIGANVTGGRAFLYIEKTTAHWESIDSSSTRIEIRLVAYNPNAYPVPIYGFGYRATMNGVEMGESAAQTRGVIQPRSNRTIRLTVALDHEKLDEWWRAHLERDETTRFRIDFSTRAESQSGVVQLPLDSLTYTRRIETDLFVDRPGSDTRTNATSSRSIETAEREVAVDQYRDDTVESSQSPRRRL